MSDARPLLLAVDAPLPPELGAALAPVLGSIGAAMRLADRMFFLKLDRVSAEDLAAFRGPAELGIARMESFLVLTPRFRSFNFDMIWSPAIAARTSEPLLEPVCGDLHPVLNFVLIDDGGIVRGLRAASISPQAWNAIVRAQAELVEMAPDQDRVMRDVTEMCRKWPASLPPEIFHEIAPFGE